MDNDLKYPSNSLYYSGPSKIIETHVKPKFTEEDRRLIDNKIWTRDELKKLRGKTARRRSQSIKDTLHEVHRPWHERESTDTE